jgi:dTDP-4-amino-4,6-dideoxygalactose transaminase
MSASKPIYVTQPDLPPLDDFIPMLEQIWDSKILTNGGPFHQRLEDALCEYLGVPYISLFANGTIALVTAIRALGISGDVITTPYSFVATAHALLWNDLTPVFVDIDPTTLNLDPAKIEAAITPQTTAILPVHCYGNPCDVEAIEDIADRHNLKVIYDAAHAFGVQCHCGSILNHGDLSVLSFHATKVFNTLEGGAIVCHDAETKRYIDQLKNFGFTSETTVEQTGINGKMNEMNAAIGLLQLHHVDRAIEERKSIDAAYRHALKDIPGIHCYYLPPSERHNYSYFPIFVEDDNRFSRDELYSRLKAEGINVRRYFYPLITEFPMYRAKRSPVVNDLSVSKAVAERVICLPIYPSMTQIDLQHIVDVIKDSE